jgi:cell division protein FtsW (lipid II flippase)
MPMWWGCRTIHGACAPEPGCAGGLLLIAGVALLVLPGPGLLLVLAGLIVLANAFPAMQRFVAPVRKRATKAMEESVSSPLRLAFAVATGLVLIAAGVVWGCGRTCRSAAGPPD